MDGEIESRLAIQAASKLKQQFEDAFALPNTHEAGSGIAGSLGCLRELGSFLVEVSQVHEQVARLGHLLCGFGFDQVFREVGRFVTEESSG